MGDGPKGVGGPGEILGDMLGLGLGEIEGLMLGLGLGDGKGLIDFPIGLFEGLGLTIGLTLGEGRGDIEGLTALAGLTLGLGRGEGLGEIDNADGDILGDITDAGLTGLGLSVTLMLGDIVGIGILPAPTLTGLGPKSASLTNVVGLPMGLPNNSSNFNISFSKAFERTNLASARVLPACNILPMSFKKSNREIN